MVVADMCVNTFKRVELCMMEFVPRLPMNDERCAFAKARWGIDVRRGYPDPSGVEALDYGVYCDEPRSRGKPLRYKDVHALWRADTGLSLMATGHKKSDSMGRRAELVQMKDQLRLHPLADFKKADVLGYMRAKGLPLPRDEGRNSNAVGLTKQFVLWAHDHSPADYRRLCEVFVYLPAIVEQRRFYGDAGADDR